MRRAMGLTLFVFIGLLLTILAYAVREEVLEPHGVVGSRASPIEVLIEAALVLAMAWLAAHRSESLATKLWSDLPHAGRATLVGASLVLANLVLALIAYTSQPYLWLVLAGVIDGAVVAILVVEFAAARVRTALGAFLVGMTLDNIGAKETALRKGIAALSDTVRGIAETAASQRPAGGDGVVSSDLFALSIRHAVWVGMFVIVASLLASWLLELLNRPQAAVVGASDDS